MGFRVDRTRHARTYDSAEEARCRGLLPVCAESDVPRFHYRMDRPVDRLWASKFGRHCDRLRSRARCSFFGPWRFRLEIRRRCQSNSKSGIENQHPAYFYILAEKLFAVGKKDEPLFWYYAGQLRYRVYLLVNKDKLDPTGDPAVFAALSEEIGRPINEYAFSDIPRLAKDHRCGPGLGRITF
jgi:hypothetical protein